jgi:putative methionine-R-sulfoxide reductase with GAF domain
MAEDLHIIQGSKAAQYQGLLPQLRGLLEGETDFIANMANTCAALKEQFGWLWVGFYLIKEDELVLGPFQGPVACTRIQKGGMWCVLATRKDNGSAGCTLFSGPYCLQQPIEIRNSDTPFLPRENNRCSRCR